MVAIPGGGDPTGRPRAEGDPDLFFSSSLLHRLCSPRLPRSRLPKPYEREFMAVHYSSHSSSSLRSAVEPSSGLSAPPFSNRRSYSDSLCQSVPPPFRPPVGGLSALENLYGKKLIVVDREMVEDKADAMLDEARRADVAFLVVGMLLGNGQCDTIRRRSTQAKILGHKAFSYH